MRCFRRRLFVSVRLYSAGDSGGSTSVLKRRKKEELKHGKAKREDKKFEREAWGVISCNTKEFSLARSSWSGVLNWRVVLIGYRAIFLTLPIHYDDDHQEFHPPTRRHESGGAKEGQQSPLSPRFMWPYQHLTLPAVITIRLKLYIYIDL